MKYERMQSLQNLHLQAKSLAYIKKASQFINCKWLKTNAHRASQVVKWFNSHDLTILVQVYGDWLHWCMTKRLIWDSIYVTVMHDWHIFIWFILLWKLFMQKKEITREHARTLSFGTKQIDKWPDPRMTREGSTWTEITVIDLVEYIYLTDF